MSEGYASPPSISSSSPSTSGYRSASNPLWAAEKEPLYSTINKPMKQIGESPSAFLRYRPKGLVNSRDTGVETGECRQSQSPSTSNESSRMAPLAECEDIEESGDEGDTKRPRAEDRFVNRMSVILDNLRLEAESLKALGSD